MSKILALITAPLVAVTSFCVAGGIALTKDNKNLQNENKNLTETVTQITDENNKLKTERDTLQTQIVENETLITSKDANIQVLTEEKQTLQTSLSEKQTELDSVNSLLVNKTLELEGREAEIQTLNAEKIQLENDKQSLQSNLISVTNNLTEKTNQYNTVCSELENANVNIEILQNQKAQLESEISQLENDKTTLENSITEKDEEITSLNFKLNEQETIIEEQKCQITLFVEERFALQFERDEILERLKSLEGELCAFSDENLLLKSKNFLLSDYLKVLEENNTSTTTAGLYETGTQELKKSWVELINDGDIFYHTSSSEYYTSNLYCPNKNLAGDFVCVGSNNIESLSMLCMNCENLNSVNLSQLDTSNVVNMYALFYGCKNLKSVNLLNVDTKNVTTMQKMFYCCSSLTQIDLSNFNTGNVLNMESMFGGCKYLNEINLTNFDFTNVTNFSFMFSSCENLTILNLSSFGDNPLADKDYMFSGCSKLKEITYQGTIAEWKSKGFSSEDANGSLADGITVHCTDGDYVTGTVETENYASNGTYKLTSTTNSDVVYFKFVENQLSMVYITEIDGECCKVVGSNYEYTFEESDTSKIVIQIRTNRDEVILISDIKPTDYTTEVTYTAEGWTVERVGDTSYDLDAI